MLGLSTGLPMRPRLQPLAVASWVLFAIFVGLWVMSLEPFYASGLQSLSDTALQYAGGGYARFNIPYSPTFENVYGDSIMAVIARSVICYGPCLYILAVGGVLVRLLTSWRSYSRVGIILRTAALLVTLTLIALSFDMASKFFIWGLG